MADNQRVHSSFIPKKSLSGGVATKKSPMGLLNIIAMLIFFLALAGWGGMYFYGKAIENEVVVLEESLAKVQDSFEPELLRNFKELDKKLRAGETLINKHTALTPFFEALEDLTLIGVQYDSVDYNRGLNSHLVSMTGRALDFPAIALQADELAEDRRILNPVFSGFRRANDGTDMVEFDLSFSISPQAVKYVNTFSDTQ